MKLPDDPSTPPPLPAAARAVGSVLAGQRIEAVLQAGPVFTLYRVVDALGIERTVLKEYCPQALCERDAEGAPRLRDPEDAAAHAAFEAGRAAFVEELRQLARLRLPGLVRVRELIEADGSLCALMPLLPGVPLDQLPASPNDEALHALLLSLLEPLAQLHAAGLVHGGLHARQLLWSPGRTPVLLGFGAAAHALGLAPMPDDRAPELRAPSAEAPLGPWTDVYALAAMVLRQLSGRPWDDSAAGEGVAALLERALGPARDAARRQLLVAALQASLAPEPAQRPQHAGALRERLVVGPARASRAKAGEGASAAGAGVPPAGHAPRGEPARALPAMRADGGFVLQVPPRRRDDSRRNAFLVLLLAATCLGSGWWVRGLWTQEQERQRVDRLLASAAAQLRQETPAWSTAADTPQAAPAERGVAAPTPAPAPQPQAGQRLPEDAVEERTADRAAPAVAGVAPAAVSLPPAEVSSAGTGGTPTAVAAAPVPVPPSQDVAVSGTGVPIPVQAPPAAPALPAPTAPVAAQAALAPAARAAAKATPRSPAPVAARRVASASERVPRKVEASGSHGARTPSRPVAAATNPRAACGAQTKYALLQCMQRQCRQPEQRGHLQCQRLLRENVISS